MLKIDVMRREITVPVCWLLLSNPPEARNRHVPTIRSRFDTVGFPLRYILKYSFNFIQNVGLYNDQGHVAWASFEHGGPNGQVEAPFGCVSFLPDATT